MIVVIAFDFFTIIKKFIVGGKFMKKEFISLIMCGIMTAALGCGSSSKTENTEKKDTVTIALSADVSSLDMHKALGTQTSSVCFNIFDGLTRIDADGKLLPLLAESYKPINDTTWQFKLRKNVKFTNGENFNANVVKFNIERMLNKDYGSALRGDFRDIVGADVVDEYTVNVKTKAAFPSLPLRISYLGMVPPEYIKKVGDKEFAAKPIGTGAYKLKDWKRGNSILLEANDGYFMGKANIKQLTSRLFLKKVLVLWLYNLVK